MKASGSRPSVSYGFMRTTTTIAQSRCSELAVSQSAKTPRHSASTQNQIRSLPPARNEVDNSQNFATVGFSVLQTEQEHCPFPHASNRPQFRKNSDSRVDADLCRIV